MASVLVVLDNNYKFQIKVNISEYAIWFSTWDMKTIEYYKLLVYC